MKTLFVVAALITFSTSVAAKDAVASNDAPNRSEIDPPGTRDLIDLPGYKVDPEPNPTERRQLQLLHEQQEERRRLHSETRRFPKHDAPVDHEDHILPRDSTKKAE